MKKTLALFLSVLLLMGLMAAPAMAEQKVSLKGWGAYAFDATTGLESYKDQTYWKEVEKALGVDISWEIASTASDAHIAQFGLIMASGELPDFFANYNRLLSVEEYGRMGAIMDITPLLDGGFMPNLSAIIEEFPDVRASITSADGAIYIIPRVMIDYETRAWPGFNIRGDVLEELGLEVPTTTDEFYEVLKAMKSVEGVKYPFAGDYRALFYPFGVAVRAIGNNSNADVFVEDGEIKFAPSDPRYLEALTYLNKLASEGLMMQVPVTTYTGNADQTTDVLTGSILSTNGSWAGVLDKLNGLFESQDGKRPLVAMEYLTGPEGYKGNSSVHRAIDANWGACISSTCSNPEMAAQILDYALGKEGSDILFYGLPGEDYNRVDGKIVMTEKITSSPLGVLTYKNNYIGNYSCLPSAYTAESYLSTMTDEAKRGNAMATETTRNDPSVVPMLRFTAEEIATVNEICLDLNTYVEENMANFIFGQRPLSDWDAYVKEFGSRRVDELLKIFNDAYARYQEAAGVDQN